MKKLFPSDIDLANIATRYKTPFYLYSLAQLQHNFSKINNAFNRFAPLICYAVKANSNAEILKTIAQLGGGADCVSGGEILAALEANIPAQKIVFSGVGKTEDEIQLAIDHDILQINAESLSELKLINLLGQKSSKTVRVGVRVNPDVDCGSHEKISTGKKDNKFGISQKAFLNYLDDFDSYKHLSLEGISVHIGSQILSLAPYEAAFNEVENLLQAMDERGFHPETLDLGGGFGVQYTEQDPEFDIAGYASLLEQTFADYTGKIIIEPGRYLVADAGILISKVLYIKNLKHKKIAIIDAGMNDFMRPALYGAHHDIFHVSHNFGDIENYDIVGPICESSDVFVKNYPISKIQEGDFLYISKTGAYGASMASSYNKRPLIKEYTIKE